VTTAVAGGTGTGVVPPVAGAVAGDSTSRLDPFSTNHKAIASPKNNSTK